MASAPTTIGVVGAGTMGAGIARVAADAGMRVLQRDPLVGLTDDLSGCDLVIEAVPERLELKQELVRELEAVLRDDAVIASNTSSISITAIAAGAEHPERVVGMHFFNPPPRMRLVEVVAGLRSGAAALALARAAGEAMGKHVIDTPDTPGFLVNRCNRPFNLEALRIVAEGIATPAQVDRIVRMGGGYPMGPFELMDLVGLDTTFDVQTSFWEQSFGEPRWRPSGAVQRMVAAGRLGRKSGDGWYAYPRDGHGDPEPPPPGGGDGLVVVAGESALAYELLEAAGEAGWEAATPEEAEGELPALIVDCGATEDDPPLQGGPQAILIDAAPLAALDPGGASAGFSALAPLAGSRLVELTRSTTTAPATAAVTEGFFRSLGRHVEWVADAPGLVLARIVCSLVNEACFALAEGVGRPADVDAGLVLGLNHPRGALEWADLIGPAEVLAVVAGLHAEYSEERYRPAGPLRRAVRTETPLHGPS
ncbi:MAG: 3-hydroxybutyryl-CoA dehydrogenase [Solirubrobacteraceae bacterium]|nr:3-hydroxybutyryl-CoA dehydrogenase [Solirubrobacteraceae bacterium]